MYHLPSEIKKLAEAAISELKNTGKLTIYEPCNCGSQIRHDNGGNYHDIYELAIDDGKYFVKFDTTCELAPPAEWEEITKERAEEIITSAADWL